MMGILDPAILSEVALFRDLHSEQVSKLAAQLHQRTFPSGANVITAEERGDSVYVILEGTAKVYVTHTDGTEVILAILGPGEIVGEMSAADSLGRSASVLTLEESTLLWMDRHTFLSSMEEMPTIARNLIGILSRRLRLADTHTRSLAVSTFTGESLPNCSPSPASTASRCPAAESSSRCASPRRTSVGWWALRGCGSTRCWATTAEGATSPWTKRDALSSTTRRPSSAAPGKRAGVLGRSAFSEMVHRRPRKVSLDRR